MSDKDIDQAPAAEEVAVEDPQPVEDDATEAAPTMLEPLPEADAIVSTSFFKTSTLQLPDMPHVDRVIGVQEKAIGPLRDQLVPTAGSLPPPPRYDDHYGFNTLSCIEY